MNHYVMVFSDYSGQTQSNEVDVHANNLQQASLRAIRDLWAMHKQAPEIVRVALLKREGVDVQFVFSASILDGE